MKYIIVTTQSMYLPWPCVPNYIERDYINEFNNLEDAKSARKLYSKNNAIKRISQILININDIERYSKHAKRQNNKE